MKFRCLNDELWSFVILVSSFLLVLVPSAAVRAADSPAKAHKSRPPLPEGVVVERDISYLGADRAEKGDLYLPAKREPNRRIPAVLIVHGGGWSGGDKDSAREWNIGGTLASNGYAGFSINYILNNKAKGINAWPQDLYDCKTAVRWLRKNADRYGIDPEHIGAIGGSAGGHLVSMLAVTGPADGLEPDGPYGEFPTRIHCVIDLYGPIVFGHCGAIKPTDDLKSSPFTYLDKNDPPVLILHGTADKTVDLERSREFDAALTKAGVEHELVLVEGGVHSFHFQPPQRDLRPLALAFFDKHLKAGK